MSVIASKRGETKLKVIDCAEKLANYTINIVSNEKHFPKRYRWIFASKIGDSAILVNSLVHMANAIYPNDYLTCETRLQFILKALAEISNLLSLISLCKAQQGISLSNLEYWIETATFEKTLIMKWKESCREQLDKFSK